MQKSRETTHLRLGLRRPDFALSGRRLTQSRRVCAERVAKLAQSGRNSGACIFPFRPLTAGDTRVDSDQGAGLSLPGPLALDPK